MAAQYREARLARTGLDSSNGALVGQSKDQWSEHLAQQRQRWFHVREIKVAVGQTALPLPRLDVGRPGHQRRRLGLTRTPELAHRHSDLG